MKYAGECDCEATGRIEPGEECECDISLPTKPLQRGHPEPLSREKLFRQTLTTAYREINMLQDELDDFSYQTINKKLGNIAYTILQALESPKPPRLRIDQALLNQFKDYHLKHSTWHNLYNVLQRRNFQDLAIDQTLNICKVRGDTEGYGLAELLKRMTLSQRQKIARDC